MFSFFITDTRELKALRKEIMNLAEATQKIKDLTAQNNKAIVEINTKIQTLVDAAGGLSQTTPEFDAALVDLQTSVTNADNIGDPNA